MNCKLVLCFVVLSVVSHRATESFSLLISPFQWIRDLFSSRNYATFTQEQNVTRINDSSKETALRSSPSKEVSPGSHGLSVNDSESAAHSQSNLSGTELGSPANRTGGNTTDAVEEEQDRWKDYFEQLLSHDTAFCFSLLVCEISARPDSFLEDGRRVARFFEVYRPSSNSAASWYVNAAELGRRGRSLAECRANYPFCFVDTKQLVALLELPAERSG